MIDPKSITDTAKIQDADELVSTRDAAKILGVSPKTLVNWRKRKLFGVPFFTADEKRGGVWYYYRERVEQLKAVYQKGILQDMYRLAWQSENTIPTDFQKRDSSGEITQTTKNSNKSRHKGFLTAEQVAEIFHVDVRTIELAVKSGALHWDRYDHRERLLFSKETIEDFAIQRQRKNEPSPTTKETDMKFKFTQYQNLPTELAAQMRFAPSIINAQGKKKPITDGNINYAKPQFYSTAEDAITTARNYRYDTAFAALDICGHGKLVNYAMFDIDHALDPETGEFVNDEARRWYNFIQNSLEGCYAEISASGTGLHIIAEPTQGKFNKITNNRNGVLWFDRDKNIKLEVFYHPDDSRKTCHMTGVPFGTVDRRIAKGEVVDDVIQQILDEIQKHLPAEQPKTKPTRTSKRFAHSKAYDLFRAQRMLDAINPAELKEDSEWFTVISAAKNIGVPYETVDAFNQRDPERYDATGNKARWDSVSNTSIGMGALYNIAVRFDYSEKDSRREWYTLTDDDRAALFGDTSRSDYANAKRLAYLFGDQLHYLSDVDSWLTYSDGIWIIGATSRNSVIMPYATQAADILKANATTDDEHKVAACFEATRKVAPAVTFLKGIESVIVTTKDLDAHPELLNCLNGVVNLEDGTLMDADPSLLFTRQANAVYRKGYRNPVVDKFLADILPNKETREAVIRFLGYALFGLIRDHVAQFWRGDGRNGKSTLINLLLALLNTYAVKLPTTALLYGGKPTDPNQATPALNPLEGARLAICNELPRNSILDSATFKTLTGGDEITIRPLRCEFKKIKPCAKIILNGNFLPQLDATADFGLQERLRNVPYTQTFTGDRADPRLMEKLLTPDALSGMLSILVDAAQMWYRDGLLESDEMKAAKRAYIADNNFIGEFLDEYCTFGADLSIPRKALLERLKKEYPAECSQQFSNSDRALSDALRRIPGIGYRRGGKDGGRKFYGVGWNESQKQSDPFGGEPIDPKDTPF